MTFLEIHAYCISCVHTEAEPVEYASEDIIPYLHEITMQLNDEKIRVDLIFHIVHVARTRMKELDIYGLLRRDFWEVLMAARDIIK